MSTGEPFVYDWQADGETFLKWMLVELVTGIRRNGQFEELSKATDQWTRIELAIQVNGVDVPVGVFVDGVEANMERLAKREAERLLASIPGVETLRRDLDLIEQAVSARLRGLLAHSGVELEVGDDD